MSPDHIRDASVASMQDHPAGQRARTARSPAPRLAAGIGNHAMERALDRMRASDLGGSFGALHREVRAGLAPARIAERGGRAGPNGAADADSRAHEETVSHELARCVAARATNVRPPELALIAREAAVKLPGTPASEDAGTRPESVRETRTFELTFDDGPHTAPLGKRENLTEMVLDTLKAKGVKAGFFVQTGVAHRGANRIGKALVKRMHDEGHTVAIHTGGKKDHELHTTAEAEGKLEKELESAKGYVKDVTGADAKYVRPPTGAYNPAVTATYGRVGLSNLMWDIDGDQGRNLDLATLKQRFTTQLQALSVSKFKATLKPDAIVVLYHDIQRGTAENVGAIIDHIKDATAKVRRGLDIATFRAP